MRRRDFLIASLFQNMPQPAVPGSTLVHEHVLVDFAGVQSKAQYDFREVLAIARPKLEELKRFGCVRLLECTPNGLGRNARLLRALEDSTGLEIWTNTGIYGAAKRAGVPAWAHTESAWQLARRWIAEATNGVDGIQPRFIKTGVNGFPLEALDKKLIEAAAMASLTTGLAIASHTNGGGPAAEAQLEILNRLKCPTSRFVWVHAQSEKDHAFHQRVARAGAWVEFDGVSEKSAAWHRDCVLHMKDQRLLGQTLISQDAGWYHVGEPHGGEYRGYTFLYSGFLPQIPQESWKILLVDNPRRAFTTP